MTSRSARLLSNRAEALVPSATLALDARVRALAAAGTDVVNLTVGEPDFDTPEQIRDAGIQAIRQGRTKYTLAAGTVELRDAIAARLREDGLAVGPEHVVVSGGAKQSIYNALLALVDPGDDVLIPAPYWTSYPEMVRLVGGRPVPVDVSDRSTGLAAKLGSAVTERTRLVILNNPNNPTGVVYGRAELEELAELAERLDLLVLSDEIYSRLVYDTEHVRLGSLDKGLLGRVVTVDGMSKAFAMTGWRVGYAAAQPEIALAMAKLQSQTTSGSSAISQAAAVTALTSAGADAEAMRRAFDERRRYVVDRIRGIDGLELDEAPRGTFYVFPDVTRLHGRTFDGQPLAGPGRLAELLLEHARVAVVPGTAFGSGRHVRISFAAALQTLQDGFDRIQDFIAKLG